MAGDDKIRILGFAGSISSGSYNKVMLGAAQALLPKNASLEIFDISGIPLFNQDLAYTPGAVNEFKAKIKAADALLIATPEYNNSIPGVLKNAIDWGSAPYDDNSFDGKPAAVISVVTGRFGGQGAQIALRQVFTYLNVHPVNKPMVFITQAEKSLKGGALHDEDSKRFVVELLGNLVECAAAMRRGKPRR